MNEKTTVLVAEDEVGWLRMLENTLEDEGFEVIPVDDRQGVIDNFEKADVLVIDVMLGEPQEEAFGIVAVGELLRDHRLDARAPVIFVSSLNEHDDLPERKLREHEIPADRYVWLQKLFEEEELLRNINEELARRASSSSG